MAKGNLPKLLSEDLIPLSFFRRLEIAREIALGMEFLSQLSDPFIKIHDNFKSNNILVSSKWEVKIAGIIIIISNVIILLFYYYYYF